MGETRIHVEKPKTHMGETRIHMGETGIHMGEGGIHTGAHVEGEQGKAVQECSTPG